MPHVPTKFHSIVVGGRVPGGNHESIIERCRVVDIRVSSTPTKATTSFLSFSENFPSTSAYLQYASLCRKAGKDREVAEAAAFVVSLVPSRALHEDAVFAVARH